MEDDLTEIPPPSRFFQEDLNNFTPTSPFLSFSDPFHSKPLPPFLLIIAISSPSLYLFHTASSKTRIGSRILPDIPLSGSSVEPSLGDKSYNIYSLNNADNSTLLVLVQYPVMQSC